MNSFFYIILFLGTWGIAFGDTVLEGDFSIGPHDMQYSSGTGIVRFPEEGLVIAPTSLRDQGLEILGQAANADHPNAVPILGFYQTKSTENGGRIVVYGDSNCIGNSIFVQIFLADFFPFQKKFADFFVYFRFFHFREHGVRVHQHRNMNPDFAYHALSFSFTFLESSYFF